MAYPLVKRREVQQVIGDGLEKDIPLVEMVNELRRRYHVFYILPKAASYGGDREILGFWRKLLGQAVLELDDPEAVCEVIALTIGMTEGTIDLSAGIEDLREYDVAEQTLNVVTTALATLPKSLAIVKAKSGALPGLGARPLLEGKGKRL
jgi:hypothetical protein